MLDMFSVFKTLPKMVRMEYYTISVHCMLAAMVGMFTTKIAGIVFTTSVIGIIVIVVKICSLAVPLLKNLDLSIKYGVMVLCVICDAILFFVYGIIDVELWYILYMVIDTAFYVFCVALYNDFDVVLKRLISTNDFREARYMEGFMYDASAIVGSEWSTDNVAYIRNALSGS